MSGMTAVVVSAVAWPVAFAALGYAAWNASDKVAGAIVIGNFALCSIIFVLSLEAITT